MQDPAIQVLKLLPSDASTMPSMSRNSRQVLADNVKFLRKLKGWTQRDLASRCDVVHKTISNMESVDSVRSPFLQNIEAVAAVFGLEAWQLLIPGLPDELVQNPRLAALVRLYADLSDEGRDTIDNLAQTIRKAEKR